VSRQLIFTPEADSDIGDAVTWFGERSPQLQERFRQELESVYLDILDYPEMYPYGCSTLYWPPAVSSTVPLRSSLPQLARMPETAVLIERSSTAYMSWR
jgi:hypothetical protein